MNKMPVNMKSVARLVPVTLMFLLVFSTIALAQGYRYKGDDTWSFGVMGDTQWTSMTDPEGVNPDFVSAGIVRKLNEQFISHSVRFVIQLGDLSNWAGDAAMYSRANAAEPLYEAGIGFFPVRGNHETYGYFFDDTDHNMNVPAYLDAFPQTQGTTNTFGATDFTGPDIDALKGLSYSFDYGDPGNNARFVFVDTEVTSYKEGPTPEPHPIYGQGYDYPSVMPTWILYKYTEPLPDNKDGGISTIEPGSWFRIDSSGNPSTEWHGYDAIWPIDDFVVPEQKKWTSTGTEFYPGEQQTWINERLDRDNEERPEHAFVLTHRGPMNQNHIDSMFGSNPGSKSSDQNVFYNSLQSNGVRYLLSAHDHLHNRAIVSSPDGNSFIEQITSTGASTKFYAPVGSNEFISYYGDVKQRETPVSQELYNIGYYIYTVDGPRVTVDYYSDATGNFQDDAAFPYGDASVPEPLYTPHFNFVKKDTWGYGLNGKQFLFPEGTSYAGGTYTSGDEEINVPGVKDEFDGTSAEILYGFNNSTSTDNTPHVEVEEEVVSDPRPLTKAVNTGWVDNPDPKTLRSDIFSLWGMSELGADGKTDTYVLEMSYVDPRDKGKGKKLGNAGIRLCSLDINGHWVNAVNLNVGKEDAKDLKFIKGPWKPAYNKLGTYGIDMENGVVWAVINYNADFAVR